VARFLIRRTLLGLLVVAGVLALTFLIARVVPGDPAASWAGPHASPQQLAKARSALGLDKSAPAQIVDYFSGIVSGDWGTSIHTRRPVLDDLGTRLPPSIQLVVAGLILALVIGIPLGIVSAVWRGRLPDFFGRIVAVAGVSMPVFWLALLLQLLFFQRLHLLPVAGQYDPGLDDTNPLTTITNMTVVDAAITGNFAVLGSALEHLVLPAVVIAAYPAGLVARMVRGSLLETMGETHIRMVRALGFPEWQVYLRFALKPALNPVISILGLVFAYSLTNTFLVEAIFNWPGIGSYAADSVQSLDTPSIVGVALVVALLYVAANFIVDVVQASLDPRIRLR
jgi:peptide/nickel transport system permease protein